ncbi:hypothetical protein BDV12DRAFT_207012 [Aspergillus spectabilis]
MHTSPIGVELIIWGVVFTCLTGVVLGLRLWSNYVTRKGVRVPDYLAILAYVSIDIMAGVSLWAIVNGMGAPITELSPYEIGVQAQLVTASSVTWLVSTTSCKVSMLTLYLSLFHISRRFRIIIYVSCVVVTAYFVTFLVLFMTQCHPVSYGWNPVPGGGCRDVRVQQISSISANIVLDFAIAVLPIPVLWNLRMPPRSKLMIIAMFSMGLSVVGVLAWRLRITVNPLPEPDLSREIARTALPSGLEIWLSIIVVSLPALAPLFRRYVEPLLNSSQPSSLPSLSNSLSFYAKTTL